LAEAEKGRAARVDLAFADATFGFVVNLTTGTTTWPALKSSSASLQLALEVFDFACENDSSPRCESSRARSWKCRISARFLRAPRQSADSERLQSIDSERFQSWTRRQNRLRQNNSG
jgi:hypothetical protein